MCDEEDFSSDEDDVDYVPSDGEDVSEEEHSGEDEGADGEHGSKKEKKTNKKAPDNKRKRKGLLMLEEEGENESGYLTNKDTEVSLDKQIQLEKQEKAVEKQEEKKASLWASFLKDVGGPVKPNTSKTSSGLGALSSVEKTSDLESSKAGSTSEGKSEKSEVKPQGKVTITKVFDFAGEEVKITKEVDASSKEAKQAEADKEKEETNANTTAPITVGSKRPAGAGGLGSVLGKIGKKSKISTLDKSKLDWNTFKQDEGIDEELQIHNRGKSGYIERQQFLQRTDLRQFEIEKELRQTTKKL